MTPQEKYQQRLNEIEGAFSGGATPQETLDYMRRMALQLAELELESLKALGETKQLNAWAKDALRDLKF